MGQEGTVGPRERVNIVYTPATGDAQEEVDCGRIGMGFVRFFQDGLGGLAQEKG